MWHGLGLARLNFTKAWMLAFLHYSAENDNRLPASFDEAEPFYPRDDAAAFAVLDPNRFEIVYRGSLRDIPNPASTIVIREREPFARTSEDGRTVLHRTYAFADGHSEIHAARDGDFESWERPRLIP